MKEKLPVADLPLGVVMHLARTATQKAARGWLATFSPQRPMTAVVPSTRCIKRS